MMEHQLEQLVRKLERYAKTHPTEYKLKVGLLAFAGYAYVLAVLGTVIGLAIGCFVLFRDSSAGNAVLVQVGLGLIVLAIVILRAIWVRLEPPSGIEIQREHAPRLFLLIDKIRNALGTPTFHHVLIVNELNAAVVQTPRLGILGWHRNYLLLGLPLMLTFTPAQFRAVLAHEFGHLGTQHGRFITWIYRARVTWWRLHQELTARQRWGSIVFTKFLAKYVPYFNAYSFVMAREQEHEADRNAAHLVGPHSLKDTLASLAVVERLLVESFWPSLDQRNKETAAPPETYLHDLAGTIQVLAHRARAQAFLNDAMHAQTGYADTHPSLADRLAALDKIPSKEGTVPASASIPQLLEVHEDSAAQYYLGQACDELCNLLNREWAEQSKETWKQRYDETQTATVRVAELKGKLATGTLTDDELWEYARTVERLEGGEAAIPPLRRLLDRSPDHVSANIAMGRLLLAQGDREGLERLERAAAKDEEAFFSAAVLAEEFLVRTGQHEEAAGYHERAKKRRELLLRAEAERQWLTPFDVYLPHDLSRDATRALAKALSAFEQIGEAYLVRKQVRVMPEVPAYVFIVTPTYRWYQWRERRMNESLLARLSQEITLPDNTYILVLGSQIKRQWKRKALKRISPLPIRSSTSNEEAAAISTSSTVELPAPAPSWLFWIKRR